MDEWVPAFAGTTLKGREWRITALEMACAVSDDFAGQRRKDAMATGILVAAIDFSTAPAHEFHDGNDPEHIPERLRLPGRYTRAQ